MILNAEQIQQGKPTITVNGVQLTSAQCLAVQVALNHFAIDLEQDGLGDDDHGKEMTGLYLARIAEVSKLIYGS